MNDDQRYLLVALEQARQGRAEGGVPVGAALVVDGEVLGVGHNRRVQMNSVIRHGETDCLENIGRLPASVYRRATLYFHKRDYVSAMADLRAVLAREPRHFGAWAGLGMILNDVGDERRALIAFRRAVELYPRMERIPDLIKRLTETVDGRDL